MPETELSSIINTQLSLSTKCGFKNEELAVYLYFTFGLSQKAEKQ